MATSIGGVILGYKDEEISPKNSKAIDFTCNKIGGKPDYCYGSISQQPFCSKCKKKMLLVVQIYAPLEGSPYHRVLYVFACITPECWNKSHSWVCLRSQCLAKMASQAISPASPKTVTSEMWLSDQDDWGSSDDDGDGNGNTDNFSYTSQTQLDNKSLNSNSVTIKKSDNLNKINANTTASIAEMAMNMETQINLNEDDGNANEALCGAVAMQLNTCGGTEASALIEGPEGDMIAVESPERPSVDIPALLNEVVRIDDSSEISFISSYISSDTEPPEDTGFSEHERELFLHYTHSSGNEFRDEEMGGTSESKGCDGIYEKTMAHHGDILLYKFKKRMMRSPQQILRYCRDESASPLWLYPLPIHEVPARCSNCSGRLVFEVQIMPQLINYLRIAGVSCSVLEFGTIAIYTCLSSCWKEGDVSKQEVIFIQGEATS